MTKNITARIASVMGMTIVNAARPMIGTMMTSISSVPYAEEEIMSGASTPMATGVASRSWVSCSETSGGRGSGSSAGRQGLGVGVRRRTVAVGCRGERADRHRRQPSVGSSTAAVCPMPEMAAGYARGAMDLLEWSRAHRHRRLRKGRLRARTRPRGGGSLGRSHRSQPQVVPAVARGFQRARRRRIRVRQGRAAMTRKSPEADAVAAVTSGDNSNILAPGSPARHSEWSAWSRASTTRSEPRSISA